MTTTPSCWDLYQSSMQKITLGCIWDILPCYLIHPRFAPGDIKDKESAGVDTSRRGVAD